MRIFAVALLMTGCGADSSEADWSDQVSPAGPCWEVNILDGLDESSTEELHGLFDCLNQGGNLDPFRWQFNKNKISKLLLCEISYANRHDIVVRPSPCMLSGIFHVVHFGNSK